MERRDHWETIYQTRDLSQVGWYQEFPRLSLEMIQSTGVDQSGSIIDVGGGTSLLAHGLLMAGYQHISVLDISAAALRKSRTWFAEMAGKVTWIEADITRADLPHHAYDVWHDRAVFHFLTDPTDRQRYVQVMQHALKPGGHAIIATFALDGPTTCSGLEVVRYSPDSLHAELGATFTLTAHTDETHVTPSGGKQHFVYCCFRLQPLDE